jgi:glycosyltransferase involved in cell wall biosynthesis
VMTTPLVTIGIPTYNRAGSYLRGAVHAALGQTYGNIEVLISDNCSTDNTAELTKGIADPRLRYFRQVRNVGPRDNMNFLLSKATGQYFHLYADDDQIDADFVEVCVDAARSRPMPGLIMTGARVIDQNGDVLRQKESDASLSSVDDLILHWYLRRIHLFLCSTLFNTQTLRNSGGFEEQYGNFDDVAAEFKCAATRGYLCVPAVKAGLRVHPTSITKTAGVGEWCDSSLALLNLAMSLASSRRPEIAAVAYRAAAVRNYILAFDLPSVASRWKAHFVVLRKFGYRYWPERQTLKSLLLLTLRAPFATRRTVT